MKYRFGEFTLDLEKGILMRGDELPKINARALQVLVLLVENAGQVVSKEEFFGRVWHDAHVEDNNLTVAVTQIRKALGETKDNKFIETVPKKGYRFVAPVEPSGDAPEPVEKKVPPVARSGWRTSLASRRIIAGIAAATVLFTLGAFWRQGLFSARDGSSVQSVAVLPLTTDGQTPGGELLAAKLTQELIFNLGRLTDKRLSSFESVAGYSSPETDPEKAGRALRVESLVTGVIRRAGESSELEIKISDRRRGEVLFTKKYSLAAADLVDSQYRAARDLARALGGSNDPPGLPALANFDAYQSYLEGRHELTGDASRDYEKAIDKFTEAVVNDPSFVDAYSAMATAYVRHGLALYGARGLSASRKSFPAAKEAAGRALGLRPDSDEALAALAFVQYHHEYDWTASEANFKKALEINPNNVVARRWFGEFLHRSGRFDEGFAEQQKALALDPNSAGILSEIAWGHYLARRFDEAAEFSDRALFLDRKHASTLYNLSEVHEQNGNLREAVELWKEAMFIESAARRWIANVEQKSAGGRSGFARAKAEWLEDLIEKDYVYPTDLAKCYAVLGDKDRALDWLEKGVESRVPDILSVKYVPAFDALKNETRFRNVLKKMNFPE